MTADDAATGTVVHAYGLVDPDDRLTLPRHGIGGAPVETLSVGPVAAVCSTLSREEYGPEQWQAHAEDPEWLGRVASAHNDVLQALVDQTDVLPLRLPALHGDADELRKVLDDDRDALVAALGQIRGHVEWGVKVYLVAAPQEETAEPPSSGRDYLMRKASATNRKEEASRERQSHLLDAHEALAMASTHAAVNQPQDRALTGRREPMLLNTAYLVPRDARDSFLALAEELGGRLFEHGMALEVSGPWPAYNFAGRSDESTAGRGT